jgi:hypothetical protein
MPNWGKDEKMTAKYPKWPQNIPIEWKIYQMATKYTNCTENLPNDHKIYQHLPLQDPPKFTQIDIFGKK